MRFWVVAGVCVALVVAGLFYWRRGPERHALLREGEQRILADPKDPMDSDPPPVTSNKPKADPCDPNDPMCGGL